MTIQDTSLEIIWSEDSSSMKDPKWPPGVKKCLMIFGWFWYFFFFSYLKIISVKNIQQTKMVRKKEHKLSWKYHTRRFKLSYIDNSTGAQKSQSKASYCKLELPRFSTSLRIQDLTKCGKGMELHGGWGDTPQKKVYWEEGTPHILSWWREQLG